MSAATIVGTSGTFLITLTHPAGRRVRWRRAA